MKTKKVLITTLALACIAMFMVACGLSIENDEPTQLNNYIESNEQNAPPDTAQETPQTQQPPSSLQPEDESMFTHIFDTELEGLRITRYHGELTQVMLPDEIMGFPIVAIDSGAFDILNVTDVFFPDTVQYFGWGGNRRLEDDERIPQHWVIPYGVTHLYRWTDRRGNLTVRHGGNVRYIDIPPTVQYIENQMFNGFTSLTSLTIPYGVTRIGFNTFFDTPSLLVINFPPTIEYAYSTGLQSTSWWATQPDGVVYVGGVAYRWKGDIPSNTSVVIRDGTVTLGANLFQPMPEGPERATPAGDAVTPSPPEANIISVTLPDGLVRISREAFRGTSLTSIVIPDSVVYIEWGAFDNNTPLDEATQTRIREIQGQ